MGATTRNSTLYDSRDVSKYLQDRRDIGGPVVPIKFALTVVSAANTSDIYNMFTMPKLASMIMLYGATNGLGPSAGGGRTFIMGDSGDTDRLVASTDADAVNAGFFLAFTGIGWRPTTDTIVYCTLGGAAPVVGQQVAGHCLVVLGQ